MRLKLLALFLAGSTWLTPVPAQAEPISTALVALAATTQAGLLSVGLPTALVGAVGSAIVALPSVALTIGLNFAANALLAPSGGGAGPSVIQRPPESVQANFTQAEAPRYWIGGRNRVGGTVVLAESRGGDLYKSVAHGDSEITQRITYYLGNRPVGNLADGAYVTDDLFQFEGRGYYRLYGRFGTADQAAQPILTAAFSEWTSEHRGAGVADTTLVLHAPETEARSKILNNRGVLGVGEPDISTAAWWGRYYDPRRDSTQSFGAGPERVNDPSTWSANIGNLALMIATHRIDPERFAMDPDDINWENIAEQANICEEVTETGEQRYLGHVAFNKKEDRNIDAENAMLAACDGIRVADEDGRFCLIVGKFEPDPELILTDADLFEIESEDGDDGESLATHYLASFTAPELDFKATQTSPFVIPGWQEGQDVRSGEPQYYAIQDANQGFRVLRAAVLREHEQLRLSALAGIRALSAKYWMPDRRGSGRFLRIVSDDDYISGVYEVAGVSDPHDGLRCGLALVRCASDRWNLNGEPEAPPPNFNTDVEGDGALENIADADMSIGAGGAGGGVIFRAYTAEDLAANRDVTVQYRQKGTANWLNMIGDRDTMTAVSSSVISGAVYAFRWRVSSFSQGVTDWSSIREVTATADATANGAVSGASATGGTGVATVDWTTPNETNFYLTRVYRATNSTDFADASAVADVFGTANDATTFEQTSLAAATYSYWLETFNFSYGAGTRSGPFNAVVTA